MVTASTRRPYCELAAIKMVAVEVRSLIAVEMVAVSGRSSTKTVAASTPLKVRASCDLNSAGGIFHFNRSLVAVKKMIAVLVIIVRSLIAVENLVSQLGCSRKLVIAVESQ